MANPEVPEEITTLRNESRNKRQENEYDEGNPEILTISGMKLRHGKKGESRNIGN